MKIFKLICKIGLVLCILSFLVILKLWITNDPILLHGFIGFLIWGITIVLGGILAILMKKYNCFHLLSNITLITTIVSVGLLIVTGVISITISSMP